MFYAETRHSKMCCNTQIYKQKLSYEKNHNNLYFYLFCNAVEECNMVLHRNRYHLLFQINCRDIDYNSKAAKVPRYCFID